MHALRVIDLLPRFCEVDPTVAPSMLAAIRVESLVGFNGLSPCGLLGLPILTLAGWKTVIYYKSGLVHVQVSRGGGTVQVAGRLGLVLSLRVYLVHRGHLLLHKLLIFRLEDLLDLLILGTLL